MMMQLTCFYNLKTLIDLNSAKKFQKATKDCLLSTNQQTVTANNSLLNTVEHRPA